MAYNSSREQLRVPRTPLESRQGYHPKGEDQLVWKSPPTRQLTRQKRVEYESDIRERFYDDYIGERTSGDAGNEVLTGLAKLKFDPNLYRVNAYQGLVYDPMRTVPVDVDLHGRLQAEKEKERYLQMQQHRQRRMSDSFITSRPTYSRGQQRLEPIQAQAQLTGNPSVFSGRPSSAIQKDMESTLSPELVPGVEDWLASANPKDKEVASNFFRTLSSHGKRPDPAAKAALHRTRVRSAVMTPSRKQREERAAQNAFQQLARETATIDQGQRVVEKKPAREQLRRRRSLTEKNATKGGSMFTAKKQQPSHFTVHPDWASESVSQPKKK